MNSARWNEVVANLHSKGTINGDSNGSFWYSRASTEKAFTRGLSAGEKSNIKLNDIIVNQAKTGIAVKDSSIVTANKLSLKKTTKCLDIYRKKQEFSGGILNLNNLNCETGTIDIQAGSFTNH